ncbi:MAG: hypothetical protein HYS61_08130 [Acidobacteria bacterium]|nr:hypothetical protein [Acidobacteriota bacterium]
MISDPTGFEAILTDECWQHITARHPEMGPFRQFVVETIQQPEGIYSGKRDPTRTIYQKKYVHVPGLGGSLDLLVFVGTTDGYVATAYFSAYSLRMLGDLIWPSR